MVMQQICRQCQASFDITDDDLAFYDKVSPVFAGKKELIPPPTLCPECRQQRRNAWRNETTLYRRTCDLCSGSIISLFHSDSPATVYCPSCFWSDQWDDLASAQTYDPSKSFFRQYEELLRKAPLLGLINMNTENSEYCNRIYDGRNNYLSYIVLFGSEGVMHSYYAQHCKDVCDVRGGYNAELSYELTDCDNCYHCFYSQRIRNCSDSWFLQDCSGCRNCFLCKNLHQKEYCIRNEQLTKEEYQLALQSFAQDSYQSIQAWQEEARVFFLRYPHRAELKLNCENASGAYITDCKDCEQIFDLFESERMKYCVFAERSHDCADCYGFHTGDFVYESTSFVGAHQQLFCADTSQVSDILYGYCLYNNSADCFGCVGLKKKRYCILNKQYTKEEYETLVPRIIEKMRKTPLRMPDGSFAGQEWGEFFPVTMSPFAYNETVAQEYFPMTKEEVLARGWKWRDQTDEIPKVERVIPAAQLPDAIDDIPDDILNWAIECDATKRPFKIIKQELEFYRNMRLPVPRLHPDERHRRRMALRNPRKLWKRECMKCGKGIESSYSPDRPEIVYCESCYLASVY